MEVRAVNRYVVSFKRIAAQVAHREGVGMGTFIGDRGLNDFLIDQSENADVVDIAGKALLAFCVEDGRFNGFIAGLKTVLQFLSEHMEAPAAGASLNRCLVDLHQVLASGPTESSIKTWITSYYT
jgi:hypothetical protein